ncbi:MAG: recombinase family protein [Pseudomonadota bacterium]
MIRQRCAIYTRKSTEEGLEQDFNSLDAQREACSAYITSQKHEGWTALSDRYDDGGFSGGSMERPALEKLLADIQAGRIDIVVVYKVDRLTRALSDFAKIVEIFDGAGVSFVSVTQAFNTTTSMGRLTLNVLLSFAQFEREVTAERIRDKVAASRKKGMWMGGAVPFGYEARDKALHVNEEESAAVRTIFSEYLRLGSVRALRARLAELGIVSKRRIDRLGQVTGGRPFSRGALYHLLRNPLYIGKARHGTKVYDGLHAAIIDQATWQAVQAKLNGQGGGPIPGQRGSAARWLDGRLFDREGRAMRTTFATKSVIRNGVRASKRYWYYTSKTGDGGDDRPIRRLPADATEALVADAIATQLADRDWLVVQVMSHSDHHDLLPGVLKNAAARVGRKNCAEHDAGFTVRDIVHRIDHLGGRLSATLDLASLGGTSIEQGILVTFEIEVDAHQKGRAHPIVLTAKGAPRRDPDLIALIADARRWRSALLSGSAETIAEITKREGLRKGAVSRVLQLAWLAPDISTAILGGRQPKDLTATRLRSLTTLPISWEEQRKVLGFERS